jgi:ribosome modulation factor
MTAFEEGVRARVCGDSIDSVPYRFDQNKIREWFEEWKEADKGDDCENGRGGDDSK